MSVVGEIDPYLTRVNEVIDGEAYNTLPLSDFGLPDIKTVDGIEYAVHGDPTSEKWVVMGPTFLTPFRKPHFQLKASITQKALGEGYSVLAVDHYPNKAEDARTRGKISEGNYGYMTDRFQRVIDGVLGKKDVEIFLSGYSLCADVLIQLAHDMEHNPNRGVAPVVGLLAVEFARSTNRGTLRTLKDMSDSGKDMSAMIYETKIRAMDEAWGIKDGKPSKKAYLKAIDMAVVKGLIPYFAGVDRPNIPIIRASGTDTSTTQLRGIKSTPVSIGKAEFSTICTSDLFDVPMSQLPANIGRFMILGRDHGAGDQTREDAARVLRFVETVNQ